MADPKTPTRLQLSQFLKNQDMIIRFQQLFEAVLNKSNEFKTQYDSPNATGFNIQVTNNNQNTHLILTPVAGYAAGTVTLPAIANILDKQRFLLNTTQAVTALTTAGNGASVIGAPTTLAANDSFKLKYDASTTTWYRID